ncbi:MAG TPA: S41 family peptidase [Gemmataceae bacterium]|nr:S41 family peptidase [Gemmataceae bacterium]
MQNENKRRYLYLFLYSAFCILHSALFTDAAPAPSPVPAPPPPPPTHPPAVFSDAESFAHNLLAAVNWVTATYVRPVSRAELLQTTLTALYDAASLPVPRNLRRRIDQAEKEAAALAGTEANGNFPAPLVPALAPRHNPFVNDRPVLDLVRGIRAEIGKSENLQGENPLRICCHVMLRSLDPYSDVITPDEEHRTIGSNPERDGFGLEVPESGTGRFIIKNVLPGSPAQRAGLRAGDEIIRLRDSDGRERQLKESLDVLNGRTPLVRPDLGILASPQPIKVTFRRPSLSRRSGHEKKESEQTVTLDWERFRPENVFGVSRRDDNSWNYWLDARRKIAHLRLGGLVDSTPEDLSEIISHLRQNGLRGLILDLRWCPGGALSGSYKTAELFVGEGTIATVQYRTEPETVFRSTNEDKLLDFPMVVLINGESTGGAEMIAAALQDHHRAVMVGQRTRGKGNVQKLRGFGSIGLKVTSGTILRPSGKPLHRFPDGKPTDDWGVHPDPTHEFRISPDLSRALRTAWERQTMRPGSSAERLLLDDPLADPQRNAALEALTEAMNRKGRAKVE